MQRKCKFIDLNARDSVSKSAISEIKCSVGLSICGKRIKTIDKKNDFSECPSCDKEESREHVLLCEKNKKTRDEWISSVKVKFKEIAKNRNDADCKKRL